jgi:hypothetical protein
MDPELRLRIGLMTTPKRHLVDPTLAATLLDYCPSRLIQDPNDFGFLFESLATRDARVFAAAIDTSRFHYQRHLDGHRVRAGGRSLTKPPPDSYASQILEYGGGRLLESSRP